MVKDDLENARRIAERLALPFEPLEEPATDAALWGEVPIDLLVRYACVPVRHEGGRIVLAFAELADPSRIDELESLLGRSIEAVVAPAERVSQLLKRHHGGEAFLEQASAGKYITEPYGMVLVTGPTGSGKTTTLYAALSEIASPEDKIITIEDPLEYRIPGIVQVPVNEKKGLTFARGLRSILRHDPDKIMVGAGLDRRNF